MVRLLLIVSLYYDSIIAGGAMKTQMNDTAGIQRIVSRYKALFRVPENLNFYSEKDLMAAERKFLKFAIMNGGFESGSSGKKLASKQQPT